MIKKHINAYRINTWFNTKDRKVEFGVDAKVNGKWYHVIDGDKPCIYPTEKEASAKIKELAIKEKVL